MLGEQFLLGLFGGGEFDDVLAHSLPLMSKEGES